MNDLAVRLHGVGKTYSHFELQDIDLSLPHGQIMGFIGPNGAGKSTTIRILLGLVQQDRGDVRVLGHSLPKEQVAAKWDIGFASEDIRLYGRATLAWHLDFMASIFRTWDASYSRKLLQSFGLKPEQRIKGLSHGQRVKASLLLVLARRPKLLILDEPTTGLDPVARREILGELMEVLADEERTILFSSHNTQDIEQLSGQVTFIDQGRIVDSRDKESFLESWRRIRLDVPLDTELPDLPSIVECQRSGRLAAITTKDFSPSLVEAYQARGATVQKVETLSLEEIFVAHVALRRRGEAA